MRILFKINNKLNYFCDKLFILYLKNVKGIIVGEKCHISRKASFKCIYGTVKIEDGCTIEPYARLKIVHNVSKRDKVIVLEKNVFIGYGSVVEAGDFVQIGQNSMIGPYCFITDANHVLGEKDKPIASQGGIYKPTIVERNVWIGTQCQILSGTKIGSNSIIAANSTVINIIEGNSLIVGIPAKIKKKLFN